MTNAELRAAVVSIGLSREKQNHYTQGSKRTQVGSGWSDCSSFVRWCYLQVLDVDIGLNTAEQIVNRKLMLVDSLSEKYPREDELLPGDLLFYKGTDASRPFRVGHVEMYIGDGKLLGHGSGVGPTVKDMKSYSATRSSKGRGYIRTLRVIPGDEHEQSPADFMAPTYAPPTYRVTLTGERVNLRRGPGTDFPIARVGEQGATYPSANSLGWRAILVDGEVCWVSAKMSKAIE